MQESQKVVWDARLTTQLIHTSSGTKNVGHAPLQAHVMAVHSLRRGGGHMSVASLGSSVASQVRRNRDGTSVASHNPAQPSANFCHVSCVDQ